MLLVSEECLVKITVPIHVTTVSMLKAKLVSAMRPSRLALMAVAAVGMGVGAAQFWAVELWLALVGALSAIMALRLFGMGVAGLVGRGGRRFNGLLTVRLDGLALARAEDDVEVHPWSWVIDVTERADVFVLQLDERGGRVWVFLSKDRLEAAPLGALRELFQTAGKLS